MPDAPIVQMNRRQFLTMGLAVAGGVVTIQPRQVLTDDRQDTTRWALLSDIHVPADPEYHYRRFCPYQNFERTVAQITDNLPDSVVITGDLARSKGKTGAYENIKSLLTPVADKRPIHLGVGNHDDRDNFIRAFTDSDADDLTIRDKYITTAKVGPVRLVILDTLLYVNMFPGMLGKLQRIWLQTYLRMCDETPTILCLHHTPRADLLDRQRLFDIIAPMKKVKALVFGHSHKYELSESHGIHLINLPATGYNFTSAQPVGWVEARLTAKAGEFTLHAIGGNTSRDGSLTTLRWRS